MHPLPATVDVSRTRRYASAMFEPIPFDLELSTTRIGHPLLYLSEVDSTNRLLRGMAAQGASEGTLVMADYQHTGRGRRGRGWAAPPGSSLMLSVLLRPREINPQRAALLPVVLAVAVAEAIERCLALRPAIKWPNDILVDGKKVCGILVESEITGAGEMMVVAGIGLNVNQAIEHFSDLPTATSLRLACGQVVDRGSLLGVILQEIERAYYDFLEGWQPHDAWRRRAAMLGEAITVHPSDGPAWQGFAQDLAPDGSLVVLTPDGRHQNLHAADITIRSISKEIKARNE
jgi:BirA family transcriptional regulator, biotin operon repressor / biotin---[acetyl-CoA-carboxylase] ligase